MEIQEVIETLNKLQNEGYIKILNWEKRELIILPKVETNVVNPVSEWIDIYRNLFKGLKPGAMGDRNSCIIKMTELLKRRSDLNKEIILVATTRYVNFESNSRWKYLMQADYFISKNQGNTKDGKVSKLEAFCDEVLDNIDNSNSFIHDI
jgi:hypothetical protein